MSRSLSDLLDAVAERGTTELAESLRRCAEMRERRLRWLLETDLVCAVEDVLRSLGSHAESVEASPALNGLVALVRRARTDVEQMVDAWLGGQHLPYANAARDLMEVEWLVRDFTADPVRVADWLNSTQQRRQDEYSPARLRRRIADRECPGEDLPDSLEYQVHSETLHVTPGWPPPELDDAFRGDDAGRMVFDLSELFSHATRVLMAFDGLAGPGPAVPYLAAANDMCGALMAELRQQAGLGIRRPVQRRLRLDAYGDALRARVAGADESPEG